MAGTGTLVVKDGNGANQTINTVPPSGSASPANSWPMKAFDNLATGTIAAATANAAYTVALGNGEGVVGFSVSGLTASGATLIAEATNNSGAYVAINTILPGSGALSQTIAADGNYRVNAAGHDNVRLRVSTAGSGTIAVGSVASSGQGLVALSAPVTIAPAGVGGFLPIPTGSAANGVPIGTRPAGVTKGVIMSLMVGESVTFTIQTTQPGSPPLTRTLSIPSGGLLSEYSADLAGSAMIYVTAVTGSPLFRWY